MFVQERSRDCSHLHICLHCRLPVIIYVCALCVSFYDFSSPRHRMTSSSSSPLVVVTLPVRSSQSISSSHSRFFYISYTKDTIFKRNLRSFILHSGQMLEPFRETCLDLYGEYLHISNILNAQTILSRATLFFSETSFPKFESGFNLLCRNPSFRSI